MSSPLRLRLMTRQDLPFADSLRAAAGWNQTIKDWERFLATAPDGCFLAEWNGAAAGTATTTSYGQQLGWIGMVLVHPDYRKRGIGRALVQSCVEHLRGRGVPCIKLDATPLGRAVYQELGFQDEWTLKRWVHHGSLRLESALDARARPWRAEDAEAIELLDLAAFGASRRSVLSTLVRQSHCAMVLEREQGGLDGYGLARRGSQAAYLGPVAARSSAAGLQVLEAVIRQTNEQGLLWDIPDQNTAAVSWAERNGFTVQRPLVRMFLGPNLAPPGDPRQQFAIAGPEIG